MDISTCQIPDCTLCPLYSAIINIIDKDIIIDTTPEGIEQYELARIKLSSAYKKLADDIRISKEQFLAGLLEDKQIDGRPAICNFLNLYKDWLSLIFNIISFTQPAMRHYNFSVLYIQDINEIILLPPEQEIDE
jgi:hypothetical protein